MIEKVNILGVWVNKYTIDSLNESIKATILNGGKAVFPYVNAHGVNIACESVEFRNYLSSTGCVFCDGHGAMLGSQILGNRLPQKITYAHWFPLFCDYAQENGFSIFLLGSKPGIAEEAKKKLCESRPELKVCGVHHGYFDKTVDSVENLSVIDQINAVKPNVLLVSFGMPMQEKWLSENWDKIDANVALTGGAAIDYMAGVSHRPPRWMTDHGLEWFGRMLYEPRRLWKRYILGNPLFLLRVLRQAISVRILKRRVP